MTPEYRESPFFPRKQGKTQRVPSVVRDCNQGPEHWSTSVVVSDGVEVYARFVVAVQDWGPL